MPKLKKVKGEKSFDNSFRKPSISLSKSELPEMADWEVGKKYKLVVEVEMVQTGKRELGSDKGKIFGRFDIQGVKSVDDKKVSKMSSKEFNEKLYD